MAAYKRKFMLLDKADQPLPWRRYVTQQRAEESALKLARWLRVGNVIQVVRINSGRTVVSYKRTAEGTLVWR